MRPKARRRQPTRFDTIDKLWAGFDPAALPLEIVVIKEWDEDDIHLEMIYFTGEIFEGEKTAHLRLPRTAEKRHRQGARSVCTSTAADRPPIVEWARFWANRGYVCLSFDFCGNTNSADAGARVSPRTLHALGQGAGQHDAGRRRHADEAHAPLQPVVSLGFGGPPRFDPAPTAAGGGQGQARHLRRLGRRNADVDGGRR